MGTSKKILIGFGIGATILLLMYAIYMLMQPSDTVTTVKKTQAPTLDNVPAPTDISTTKDQQKIQVYDNTQDTTQLYQQKTDSTDINNLQNDIQSQMPSTSQYITSAATNNTSATSTTATAGTAKSTTTQASTPNSSATQLQQNNNVLIGDIIPIGKEVYSTNRMYKFTLTWFGNLEVQKINDGNTNEWEGFYMQNGQKYAMSFSNFVIKDFVITGAGSDAIGQFNINGTIKPNGYVQFTKQYVGQHSVDYFGYFANNYISGQWNLQGMSDNFQLYKKQNDVIWTSNTFGFGNIKQAKLTADGLQLFNDSSTLPVWQSATLNKFKYQKQVVSMLVMQDDGQLVIADSQKTILQNVTAQYPNQLRVSQTLFPGSILKAKNQEIYFYFDTAGFVSFYFGHPQKGGTPYFKLSNTPAATLTLQSDSNLVLYDSSNNPVWSSGTNGASNVCNVTFQDDGNLVINDCDFNVVWAINVYFQTKISTDQQQAGQGVVLKANQLPFVLYLQKNGNLVLYQDFISDTSLGTQLWQSNSPQTSITNPQVKLTDYGISLLNDGKEYWKQALSGCQSLELSNDRNLYIYDSAQKVVWKSNTGF